MAKIQFTCKNLDCNRPFIVDWDRIVKNRTAAGYRTLGQLGDNIAEEFINLTLDLKCPYCRKKASYKGTEGREIP